VIVKRIVWGRSAVEAALRAPLARAELIHSLAHGRLLRLVSVAKAGLSATFTYIEEGP
jgi:hypothetical protein